jgi:hypothetical protein
MKRTLSLALFATLLTGAFLATQSGAQPNSVTKIADGVWFREGDSKQGHSNNTIIEMTTITAASSGPPTEPKPSRTKACSTS